MAIQGAIFDFDGTIVDSMPMWTDVCVQLLQRHGVEDAQRIFEERESLDMEQKCVWYHENLGIGESSQALIDELREDVRRAYETDVHAFPGCKRFLEQLRAHNVPMVIASATPTDLLLDALESQGLGGYFEDVVFAGDVGMSKDHPHVYVAACDRLGTDRRHTWVFEDAPFGVRAAARAGFPTAAVVNDHDGRDEAFLERWATTVMHGYVGWNLDMLSVLEPRVMHALVVGGSPEPSTDGLVADLAKRADYVIAADKGIEPLMRTGIAPDLFCGDEDSASVEACSWANAHASLIERHPTDKDDTDLGLCLEKARLEADRLGSALEVTLTCVSGGRTDHALAIWGLLAHHADAFPRVIEDGYECRLLQPQARDAWELVGYDGSTVSAIALRAGTYASSWGMHWNLSHVSMETLSDRGISNRVDAERAGFCCHAGVLAVFLIR